MKEHSSHIEFYFSKVITSYTFYFAECDSFPITYRVTPIGPLSLMEKDDRPFEEICPSEVAPCVEDLTDDRRKQRSKVENPIWNRSPAGALALWFYLKDERNPHVVHPIVSATC